MNLGFVLALASLFLVVGAFVWTKNTGRPLPPSFERAVAFIGMLLAAAALALQPGAFGYGIAGVGLAISGFFFFLTFMSRLPAQRAAVSIGFPAPDFHAMDADGNEFRLSQLHGSRVLLKFFRGAWCPYCVADLRLWNDRRSELRALGLKLVAVSHDTVEELRQLKQRHRWDMTLVSDPGLEVISRYNLKNHNFTPKRGPLRDMAIPATILIDADGRVLWLDQATDFRIRSHPEKVLASVRDVLAPSREARAPADGAAHVRPQDSGEGRYRSPDPGYSEAASEET